MLAAEISRTDAECDSLFESKVRSGSSALAALTLTDSPADSASTSLSALSSPAVIQQGIPPSSSPVDISGHSASLISGGGGASGGGSHLRPGSSGRLSFLSCFSSNGKLSFALMNIYLISLKNIHTKILSKHSLSYANDYFFFASI